MEKEKREAEKLALEVLESVKTGSCVRGSDIDCDLIKVAIENAKRAQAPVDFKCVDFRELPVVNEKVYVMSNLPYGQRLSYDVLRFIGDLRKNFPMAFSTYSILLKNSRSILEKRRKNSAFKIAEFGLTCTCITEYRDFDYPPFK